MDSHLASKISSSGVPNLGNRSMQSFAIASYYVRFAPRLERLLLVNLNILVRNLLRQNKSEAP